MKKENKTPAQGEKAYPRTNIKLKLIGEDGNAFSILGRARRALRENGREDLIEEFEEEAKRKDYNHLLVTCFDYFKII